MLLKPRWTTVASRLIMNNLVTNLVWKVLVDTDFYGWPITFTCLFQFVTLLQCQNEYFTFFQLRPSVLFISVVLRRLSVELKLLRKTFQACAQIQRNQVQVQVQVYCSPFTEN